MNHAELPATFPGPAIEPTSCTGELDRTMATLDAVDGHEVRIYRCELCGHAIVIDETSRSCRNDYLESRRGEGVPGGA